MLSGEMDQLDECTYIRKTINCCNNYNKVCTLGCPKKKFCDSGQLMGEVIIKGISFYYFRFRQLFERAMLKTQNQDCIVRMRRFFPRSAVNKECR